MINNDIYFDVIGREIIEEYGVKWLYMYYVFNFFKIFEFYIDFSMIYLISVNVIVIDYYFKFIKIMVVCFNFWGLLI